MQFYLISFKIILLQLEKENRMETYTLSNGVTIPKIGFGTWQIPEGEEAYNSVSFALKARYTHIDTAQIYGNEGALWLWLRGS